MIRKKWCFLEKIAKKEEEKGKNFKYYKNTYFSLYLKVKTYFKHPAQS